MSDILAIAGSQVFANPRWRLIGREEIMRQIRGQVPDLIVSGGAVGADHLAEEVAADLGIDIRVIPPLNRRWEPDGFRARNMVIAEACTRLLSIRCPRSKTYGSGWTADYAENELKKPVERVMIDPDQRRPLV